MVGLISLTWPSLIGLWDSKRTQASVPASCTPAQFSTGPEGFSTSTYHWAHLECVETVNPNEQNHKNN
ncbi:unnamed protein product [Boreogadus saida]